MYEDINSTGLNKIKYTIEMVISLLPVSTVNAQRLNVIKKLLSLYYVIDVHIESYLCVTNKPFRIYEVLD